MSGAKLVPYLAHLQVGSILNYSLKCVVSEVKRTHSFSQINYTSKHDKCIFIHEIALLVIIIGEQKDR